jgi:hypothetical protein
MTRQTFTALALILIAASTTCAQELPPLPTVNGVVYRFSVERNELLIQTNGGNFLPPLVVGKDIQLVAQGDDKEIVNLMEFLNSGKKLDNRPVTVSFRYVGKRQVAYKVTLK